ncbi:MAG TPA: type II secretion system F family protein [Planctomycetaceae bacterium]|jgi:tight adherence protein C|nr:type II secretion system F family protein [Planctomycetaceae bacterium]
MDLTNLLPWAVFGVITFGIWALINLFTSRSSRATERLEELRDPTLRNREGQPGKTGMGAVVEMAAPALSKALQPKTELEQSELKRRLANAGYNAPGAPQMFLAIKFAMMIGGCLLGGGFGLVSWGLTQKGWTSIIVGAGLGFYLPEMFVWFIKRGRQEKIFLQLPDTLDLLVVCVEAGLGLDAGMRRVCDELIDSAPELTSEFNMANKQLQMGRPRREVLHDLGVRTGVDDMRALAAILIQADKFGSSIAQALRVQSDSMRVKRRQIAEERAAQTAVKMIFPLVLFIFPGIFVVLVGPAAISMINGLLKN